MFEASGKIENEIIVVLKNHALHRHMGCLSRQIRKNILSIYIYINQIISVKKKYCDLLPL